MRDFVGRPSPLYFARRLPNTPVARKYGSSGRHESHRRTQNKQHLGQALLTIRMGKKVSIAETGEDNMESPPLPLAPASDSIVVVYMGEEDVRRQAPNVRNMRLMGAEVRPVHHRSPHLARRYQEAMREWIVDCRNNPLHHRLSLRTTPVPNDRSDFQSIIRRRNNRTKPS